MATKRIKDLVSTATAADLVSGRYGVLDTPNITKRYPGTYWVAVAGVLGLPGAALSESDGAFLATADGKKILAAARDEDREYA